MARLATMGGANRRVLAKRRARFVAKAFGYTKATETQIGARAGVSLRQVVRITRRDGIKRKYKLKTGPKGFDTKRKLTKAQHAEIVRLVGEGLSQYELARRFRVTQPHISYIVNKPKA